MPALTAVRIHVGNQIEIAGFQYFPRKRVLRIQQPFYGAFHPPLCHGLTRVLTRDKPALLSVARLAGVRLQTEPEQIKVLPVQRLAKQSM